MFEIDSPTIERESYLGHPIFPFFLLPLHRSSFHHPATQTPLQPPPDTASPPCIQYQLLAWDSLKPANITLSLRQILACSRQNRGPIIRVRARGHTLLLHPRSFTSRRATPRDSGCGRRHQELTIQHNDNTRPPSTNEAPVEDLDEKPPAAGLHHTRAQSVQHFTTTVFLLHDDKELPVELYNIH